MKTEANDKHNYQELKGYFSKLVNEGKVTEMIDMVITLLEEISDRNTQLEQQIFQLKKTIYGKKTEKSSQFQLSLFEEPPADDPILPDVPKEQSEKKHTGGGRRAIPKDVPREDHIISVPLESRKCETCGEEKQPIGYETSEVLEYVPAQFKVIVFKREKLACKRCQENVIVAPVPNKLIDRGLPGVGLMTEIIVGKYKDHLPVHRIQNRFKRMGVDIPQSTITSWIGQVSQEILRPIAELMKKRVLESVVLQTDDTMLKVIDRTHADKIARGYLWFYIGDGRDVWVDFTKSHGQEGPSEFLKSRQGGYLLADGAPVYDSVLKGHPDWTKVGCWMHARRKFVEAFEAKDLRALPVLEHIKKLYKIEADARNENKTLEALQKIRETESASVLSEIRIWLDENAPKEPFVPSPWAGKTICSPDRMPAHGMQRLFMESWAPASSRMSRRINIFGMFLKK